MTPVTRNLPLRPLDASQANDMTPAEVSAWLDARERSRHQRQLAALLIYAYWAVALALLVVIVGCFIR